MAWDTHLPASRGRATRRLRPARRWSSRTSPSSSAARPPGCPAQRAERADARRRRGARDAVDRLDAAAAFRHRRPAAARVIAGQIVVAVQNAQLHNTMRQAKREWERTFDAISDPIAVFNDRGELLRGNRALAEHLDLPITGIRRLSCGQVGFCGCGRCCADLLGARRAGAGSVARRGDAGRRSDLQRHDVPDRAGVRRSVGRAGGEERHRGDRQRAAAAGR